MRTVLLGAVFVIGCEASVTTQVNEPEPAKTAAVEAAATTPEASPAEATATAPTATAAAKPPEAPPAPALKAFPLAEYKLSVTIQLPEDAKLEAAKSKDGAGGVFIDSKTVELRVAKADHRMSTTAAAKQTLSKMVRPAKSFLKEEKDLLVYSRGENELEFMMLVKKAGVTYACQGNGRWAKESDLEPSMAACRSIQ